MHNSAIKNAKLFINKYITSTNPSILDIGSYDVNGSLKDFIPKNCTYVGLDAEYGKNVDCIISEDYKFPLNDSSFDIIMSTSCFEHCDFFWLVLLEMARCLKVNGFIYINAPSTGPYHGYPNDYYRFYEDTGKAFVKWLNFNNYSFILLDSYIDYYNTDEWKDNVIIIQKLK